MTGLIECSADDARKIMILFAASRFTGTETPDAPDIDPSDAPMAVEGGLLVGDAYHADILALATADDLQVQYDAWAVSNNPTSPRTLALVALKQEFGALLNGFLGNPTEDEKDTRRSEAAWADAFLTKGDPVAAAMLVESLTDDEREAQGDTAAQFMAEKVKARAMRDDYLRAKAIGVRRTVEKLIEAATTDADIKAALVTGRAVANEVVAELMAAQA